jgi:two-component sensor histidine kinase
MSKSTTIPSGAEILWDRALAEANHRIANQLGILAGMVAAQRVAVSRGPGLLTSDQVGHLLDGIAGKIASVAQLHRTLAGRSDAVHVDLGKYLAESCSVIISTLGIGERLRISFVLDERCNVSAEQAQSVALIVNEILTNALKYAHPTGIPVQFRLACRSADDGQVIVETEDDGVGLPDGFDMSRDGGFGFRLIRTLVDSLDGNFDVESDSLGTLFRFTFRGVRCSPHAADYADRPVPASPPS